MSNLAQNDLQSDVASFRPETTAVHRRRPIRVLFMHRDAETVDSCLHALRNARFTVSAAVVLTLEQCAEQLRSHSYDVVLAEYPSPNWNGPQALQHLQQTVKEIPLLIVTNAVGKESIAELTAQGIFDYVEREQLAQLPMAVRRVLNEKKLLEELDAARNALRHSQSLYRALVDKQFAVGFSAAPPEAPIEEVIERVFTQGSA